MLTKRSIVTLAAATLMGSGVMAAGPANATASTARTMDPTPPSNVTVSCTSVRAIGNLYVGAWRRTHVVHRNVDRYGNGVITFGVVRERDRLYTRRCTWYMSGRVAMRYDAFYRIYGEDRGGQLRCSYIGGREGGCQFVRASQWRSTSGRVSCSPSMCKGYPNWRRL
ncbi:hypothetical protein [Nonomuraea sp. NPDC050643]|uniref:hypothetical protein n=1 Tax=Nonomuraea sp. NPDC050643 TaxID=3155660 RepID=UPI0033F85CFD